MENQENNQKIENNKARKNIGIFLGILGLIGISYGTYWAMYSSKFEETENAYVNANQISIAPSVGGTVTGLYVSDTMRVSKDMLALKIEDTDYKIALERAENDLAKAVRGFKTLKLNETQASKSLQLKETELKKANDDYLREKKTYENGLISKEEFENFKFKFEQAQINLDNAKVSLQNANNQVFSTSIRNHPDVSKAITQYRQSYIDLSRTSIKVPQEGIIAKKSVNIGQKVVPNQNLFTIIDEKNEWVDANLKESQLKKVKMGQEVSLISDVNGNHYTGYIVQIGAGSGSSLSLLPAQNATGNWIKVVQRVPVRIELDKKDLEKNGYLPIGTSMRVDIDTRNVKTIKSEVNQEISPSYDDKELEKKINQIINQNLGK